MKILEQVLEKLSIEKFLTQPCFCFWGLLTAEAETSLTVILLTVYESYKQLFLFNNYMWVRTSLLSHFMGSDDAAERRNFNETWIALALIDC